MASQKHKKFVQLLIGGLFFLLFLFAFPYGLMTDAGGQMVNCPFATGHSSICKNAPLEHIQEWQNAFTTLPASAKGILATLLLSLGLLFFAGAQSISNIIFKGLDLLYKPKHLSFSIFDPLKEAFSSGILNPKLF